MIKAFIGDAKFYFFSKIFQGCSFLLTLKIYTYFLNPKEFGEYSVLSISATMFSLFTTTWITASTIRLFPIFESKESFFKTHLSLLLLTLGLCVIPIIIFVLNFRKIISDINFEYYFLVYVFYLALCFFNFLTGFYSAARESKTFAFFVFLQSFLGLVLSFILLFFFGKNIKNIFYAQIISYLIPIIFIVYNKYQDFGLNWDKDIVKQTLSYGLPAIFISLFGNLVMSSDQLLLKYYKYHEQVGIYAANYSFIDKSINIVSNIFITSFRPILYKLWEEKKYIEVKVFFKKVISIYICIALFISVTIYSIYEIVIGYLLNSNYSLGKSFIYILIGSVLLSIGNFFSEIISLQKKTWIIAFVYIIAFGVSISLNVIYIPLYGVKAAVYINIPTYLTFAVIMILIALRQPKLIKHN
jgi:O-antigen/teichoic acid export membrane protein